MPPRSLFIFIPNFVPRLLFHLFIFLAVTLQGSPPATKSHPDPIRSGIRTCNPDTIRTIHVHAIHPISTAIAVIISISITIHFRFKILEIVFVPTTPYVT